MNIFKKKRFLFLTDSQTQRFFFFCRASGFYCLTVFCVHARLSFFFFFLQVPEFDASGAALDVSAPSGGADVSVASASLDVPGRSSLGHSIYVYDV